MDYEYSENLPSKSDINQAENKIGIKFGKQLINYLLNYGYLAKDNIELYGINNKQKLNSDMVKETLYLHKQYPKLKSYVAIENQGDGDYYLIDSRDNIYEFIIDDENIKNININLKEYIKNRIGLDIENKLSDINENTILNEGKLRPHFHNVNKNDVPESFKNLALKLTKYLEKDSKKYFTDKGNTMVKLWGKVISIEQEDPLNHYGFMINIIADDHIDIYDGYVPNKYIEYGKKYANILV